MGLFRAVAEATASAWNAALGHLDGWWLLGPVLAGTILGIVLIAPGATAIAARLRRKQLEVNRCLALDLARLLLWVEYKDPWRTEQALRNLEAELDRPPHAPPVPGAAVRKAFLSPGVTGQIEALIFHPGRINRLLGDLVSGDARAAIAAMNRLSGIRTDFVAAALVMALGRGDAGMEQAAVDCLRALALPRTVEYIWGHLRSLPGWPPERVAGLIGHLGVAAHDGLAAGLGSPHPGFQEWCLRVVAGIGDGRYVSPLVSALAGAGPGARPAILDALRVCVSSGDYPMVAGLMDQIVRGNDDWPTRLKAIQVLEVLAGPAAETALRGYLLNPPDAADANLSLRLGEAVYTALDRRGTICSCLLDLEGEGDAAEEAAALLEACVRNGCGRLLLAHYNHLGTTARAALVDILGRSGDVALLDGILPALADGDPGVRRAGVVALGRLNDPAALRYADMLARALSDPDLGVRAAAIEGLGTLLKQAAGTVGAGGAQPEAG